MNLSYQFITAEPGPLFVSFPPHPAGATKIEDLPLAASCVDIHLSVGEVARLLEEHPDWPGVILTAQDQFVGMLTHRACSEFMGNLLGLGIFSKISIFAFFEQHGACGLILDGGTSIQEAVKAALSRDGASINDPIAVRLGEHHYGLLDTPLLLRAQSSRLDNALPGAVRQDFPKDALANPSSRRGFFESPQPEVTAFQTGQSDQAVLIIYIDDFNLVNEIYGHFTGERLIRAVADECQKAFRQTDLLGRFGKEEFIALLPDTAQEAACQVAERLRQKVQNRVVYTNGCQVSATVSIRVCQADEASCSLDALIIRANQSRGEGRNQVMAWDVHKRGQAGWVRKDRSGARTPAGSGQWDASEDAARIYDETIEGWARALELRDKESRGHAQRVTRLTIELARRLGVEENDLVDIRRGALLHDIGKIAVPDRILFKPAPLTEEEWQVMHRHPAYAFELLAPLTYLQKSIDIPYCHHEHWDGSGYPRGLVGEQIPLAARIFTIIDVWDALSTDRCYHAAWGPEAVKKYIAEQSGKLFDPEIVDIFLEMQEEPVAIREYEFA